MGDQIYFSDIVGGPKLHFSLFPYKETKEVISHKRTDKATKNHAQEEEKPRRSKKTKVAKSFRHDMIF